MNERALAGAGARIRWQWAIAVLAFAASITASQAEPRVLGLNEALQLALRSDAIVPAIRSRVRGAEAGIRQADRLPNPTIGAEFENFAGSGSYRGSSRIQSTVFLQQLLELGGKREARTGGAQAELKIARARGAVRVLDLLRDVELAWIDLAVAIAQQRIAEERLSIAQRLRDEFVRRSQSGRDPLFTQSRAEAQVALEEIAVEQAASAAQIARANLASYWRGNTDFTIDISLLEAEQQHHRNNAYNVEIALLQSEKELAAARTVLERARAIPDPSLRLGVRRFTETGDSAAIAGISIPLPLFDNNDGNIEKAEADRRAVELEIETATRAMRRELSRLEGRLRANAAEARRIQSDVIPRAQRAVDLIRDGLERGVFSYVEFADAQRTLNDARLRRIDALKSFQQDNAALARLTGRHMRLNMKVPPQ